MNLVQRMSERLKGWRVYLFAVLLSVPDILTGLGAVDFSTIFPVGGAKIGAYLLVGRLIATPILINLRRASRGEPLPDVDAEQH